MRTNEDDKKVALHLLLLLYHAKRMNWEEVNKLYINWSMYLINILVHFYNQDTGDDDLQELPQLYEFILDSTSPKSDIVNRSLDILALNKYILSVDNPTITEKGIEAVTNLLLPDSTMKSIAQWIDIMVSLQSIYGYEQLFRFIYRDPEFKSKLKALDDVLETSNPLNETVLFLNEFKSAYDEILKTNNIPAVVSPKEYLIGYFGYVFDLIKRGEE
ncbi:hypothetical protein MASR1M36_06160 [Candidatus Cloacimonadaceae bacterium]